MRKTEKQAIKNIAAYRFVAIAGDKVTELRNTLKQAGLNHNLKGTILLSREGINIFLAGIPTDIDSFWACLTAFPEFAGMDYKASFSANQPFKRLLVKLKKEIVTMGRPEVDPGTQDTERIAPRELQRWFEEGKDFFLLDTRNEFEFELGAFAGAEHLGLASFRGFPEAVDHLAPELKSKPVVMFCTGGIRCEKAGPLMAQKGFGAVYQLEGGILKYFEEVGADHFRGECFVFDERIALDGNLQATGAVLCDNCQMPITRAQQESAGYVAGSHCPYCLEP